MKKLRLSCHNAQIDFLTNSEEVYNAFLNDRRQLPDNIPGIAITPYNGADLSDNYLTYLDSSPESIDINAELNQAVIHVPKKKLFQPDLNFLALSMFAKELNKEDKYIFHSAVVEKNDKAIMFIGDSGSGKTTLALHLCMDKGYKLISNDRAVIGLKDDKPYVFSGTLQTDIRVGMVAEYFPKLLDKIDEKNLSQPWKNKIFINPEFENLGIQIKDSANISTIIFTYTYPVEADATTFSKVADDVAILQIMQSASEYIRATRSVILSANYPFPSFDIQYLTMKRMKFVKVLTNDVRIFIARGNIKTLAEKINQELEGSK